MKTVYNFKASGDDKKDNDKKDNDKKDINQLQIKTIPNTMFYIFYNDTVMTI